MPTLLKFGLVTKKKENFSAAKIGGTCQPKVVFEVFHSDQVLQIGISWLNTMKSR